MALKKDKQKVLGEVFDDDRVRTFLDVSARDGIDNDFDVLEKAYRGMKASNFDTFIKFFVESGKDINAKNEEGKTLLQIASEHRQASDYIASLKNAGAKY